METLVENAELTVEGLHHLIIKCDKKDKLKTLKDMYSLMTVAQSIVFVNTKAFAQITFNFIKEMGKNVGLLTGDLPNDERNLRVLKFAKGE